MAFHDLVHPAASAARPRRVPALRAMLGLARQRHDLARLDPHLLADIGVSRDAAERETARPVWDMPDADTWRA